MLRHFDVRKGGSIPGIIKMENTEIEDITVAPESGYTQSKIVIQPGELYIFRCYNGKNYALMEIIDVKYNE